MNADLNNALGHLHIVGNGCRHNLTDIPVPDIENVVGFIHMDANEITVQRNVIT